MPTLFQLFDQGFEAASSSVRERRARGAAREQFGAAADDPVLFQQLESIENTRANRERRARITDANLSRQANVEQRTQAKFQNEQSEEQRATKLRTLNAMSVALEQGLGEDEVRERFAPVLVELGASPDDASQMISDVFASPAILDTARAALSDPQKFVDAETKAKAKSDSDEDAPSTPAALADAQAGLLKLDQTIERLDRLTDPERAADVKSILGVPGAFDLAKGGFGRFGAIPGTTAAGVAVDLEGLDGDIRSQAFETLKGGGQITEKESEFARDAIANLSRDAPFPQFQRELADLREYLLSLRRAAEIRARGGKVPDLTQNAPESLRPEGTGPTGEDVGGFTGNTRVPVGTTVDGLGTFQGGDPSNLDNWKQ